MRVLIATSEAVPFAKTGGLADVTGALPAALHSAGHDVALVMPLYRQARATVERLAGRADALQKVMGVSAVMNDRDVTGRVLVLPPDPERAVPPGAQERDRLPAFPVYFVECDAFYDRGQLYDDYHDNADRYAFFSQAVVELALALGERDGRPLDVLHANDWQSALVPVYLRSRYAEHPDASSIATLMTIHNLAYQGRHGKSTMELAGLDWSLFTMERLEFHGDVNFLKGGIVYADAVSTVSPTYSREILTPEYGAGLDGVLLHRSADLHGILNGADYTVWNPETDKTIGENTYTRTDRSGKVVCKRALQSQLGLELADEAPLVGIVARLAHEKGLDIFAAAVDGVMALGVQIVILGTGDERSHRQLLQLAERYPGRFHVTLRFDERLAHYIYAGTDMFIVPSRSEPCGLTQMYALKYGSVPIVRRTGGLADTVVDASEAEGTGFVFVEAEPEKLLAAVTRAVRCFREDKPRWGKIVSRGMEQDFSWEIAAGRYTDLYDATVLRRRSPDPLPRPAAAPEGHGPSTIAGRRGSSARTTTSAHEAGATSMS